jgi:hypothetical protein
MLIFFVFVDEIHKKTITMSDILKIEEIETKIFEIRNQKVLLDSDVAYLYGVETRAINQAVKNNPNKFPDGYIIELTNIEWNALKSKFSTSIRGGKTKLPKAFTEKGLYMLSTILKHNQDISPKDLFFDF